MAIVGHVELTNLFRNVDPSSVSFLSAFRKFTCNTLLVFPVLAEKTKSVVKSLESLLARCLTLYELIISQSLISTSIKWIMSCQ